MPSEIDIIPAIEVGISAQSGYSPWINIGETFGATIMRYRDFAPASSTSANLLPDNVVILHVRKGDFLRLEELMLKMDISICGPISQMPTGNAYVEVVCADTASAATLRATW